MIKSIYYWGMCTATAKRLDYSQYYSEDRESTTELAFMPDDAVSVNQLQHDIDVLRIITSYEDLLKQRDNNWKKFYDEFVPGDTRLFITVPEQEHQLECDMKKFDFEKYLVYKSPRAVNRNYPENGPKLRLWVFHKE